MVLSPSPGKMQISWVHTDGNIEGGLILFSQLILQLQWFSLIPCSQHASQNERLVLGPKKLVCVTLGFSVSPSLGHKLVLSRAGSVPVLIVTVSKNQNHLQRSILVSSLPTSPVFCYPWCFLLKERVAPSCLRPLLRSQELSWCISIKGLQSLSSQKVTRILIRFPYLSLASQHSYVSNLPWGWGKVWNMSYYSSIILRVVKITAQTNIFHNL